MNSVLLLHKGSMLGHKARLLPWKTIRLNVSSASPYNADFDGDEFNLHTAQTYESRAELKTTSSFEENCITPQNGKTIIGICQDNITGGFLLTDGWIYFTRDTFFNLCMCSPRWDFAYIFIRMNEIKEVFRWKNLAKSDEEAEKLLFSGYGIFSMLLPNDLEYTNYNKGRFVKISINSKITGNKNDDYKIISKEEPVVITRGVMLSGSLNKDVLGKSFNSLISLIARLYSKRKVIEFVSDYGFIIDYFLLMRGFSVGIGDCLPPDNKANSVKEEVKMAITKSFLEAHVAMEKESNEEWLEGRIINALNKAHDIGSKVAKECLGSDNSFAIMVGSGAKGNPVNITQIIALLGQQNVEGKRVQEVLNGRTLYHYPRTSLINNASNIVLTRIEDQTTLMNELNSVFESRGMIIHSYIQGLKPAEMFFHAMSGRIGVAEHAVRVSASGYGERKMVKMLEDLMISYNGTVVNSRGTVVSFSYGNDNIDGSYYTGTKQGMSFINMEWVVNRLNADVEYRKWLLEQEGKLIREEWVNAIEQSKVLINNYKRNEREKKRINRRQDLEYKKKINEPTINKEVELSSTF